jgi:hypothetical protein
MSVKLPPSTGTHPVPSHLTVVVSTRAAIIAEPVTMADVSNPPMTAFAALEKTMVDVVLLARVARVSNSRKLRDDLSLVVTYVSSVRTRVVFNEAPSPLGEILPRLKRL